MEEKNFIGMYENMFENFQEQVRIFMIAVVEKQRNNEGLSIDIFDSYKKNLIAMLSILESSLDNFEDENFKNTYKAKIKYNYQYIDELSSVYKEANASIK